MILQEITIRNWRGFTEQHTFQFCDGFNLVVGPNEAGKSTLFEALTRALFDRHSSKAEEIRSVRPLDSSLSPEVTVVFEVGKNRHKAEKRFLNREYSRLSVMRDGNWQLIHEGDAADTALRAVLSGEAAGRTVRPEHRGLAEALWYLQGEDPIPKKMWNEAITLGLGGILQITSGSPAERALADSVTREYGRYFTPARESIKAGSELSQINMRVVEQEARLADLHRKQADVEGLRQELEQLEATHSQKEDDLIDGESEFRSFDDQLNRADEFETDFEARKGTLKDAKENWANLKQDLDSYESRLVQLRKLRDDLGKASRESADSEDTAEDHRKSAERYRAEWQDEHEPALKKVELQSDWLLAIERYRRLDKDKSRLEAHINRLRDLSEQLNEAEEELSTRLTPTETELTDYEEWMINLREVQAQTDASAILVRFDLKDSSKEVFPVPDVRQLEDTREYQVTGPTRFDISDTGSVHVRGGGESLSELRERLIELSDRISATLTRFSVEDHDQLVGLHRQRIDLEKSVADLNKRIKEVQDEQPDTGEELARTEAGMLEEATKFKPAPEECKRWGGSRIRQESESLENRKSNLITGISQSQSDEDIARKAHLGGLAAAQTASNQVAALHAEINSSDALNVGILEQYGTLSALRDQVNKASDEVSSVQQEVKHFEAGFEEKVSIPRRLREEQKKLVDAVREELTRLKLYVVERQARIEQSAAQGLYSEIGDLEADLEFIRVRQQTLERRSQAAKLLHDLSDAHKRNQSAAIALPIAETIQSWIAILTDGNYQELIFDEQLIPLSLRTSHYTDLMPFASLSFGAREQITVLLRLAIGALLSKEERSLVVIDDRLVNADAVRLKRLRLILEEVATGPCQVILATCNSTPYAGMSGRVINVPSDGRQPVEQAVL